MDHGKKQALLIMISSIEAQLLAVKQLISIGDQKSGGAISNPEKSDLGYTTDEEDKVLEEAMQIPQDGKDVFMQDVFKLAQQSSEKHGDQFE